VAPVRDRAGDRRPARDRVLVRGSIPLCNVFAETYPDAEIMLMGVEEPKCLIHAPNASVDPSEIQHVALSEALFLEKYAAAGAH